MTMTRGMMMFGCVAVGAAMAAGAATEKGDGGIPIPPKPEASDGQLVVFESEEKGAIRVMNAVNGAPDREGSEYFAAWKAADIPYSRTHDLNLIHGYGGPYVIDVPWIFRDFDADENDPKSYDFTCTDALLKRIQDAGTKVFYRLGAAFEARLEKKYTIFPPKDPAKWARICEHIIAHYTEGWADGFKWDIEYWEIWNEPNLRTDYDNGANGTFWRGPRDAFKELWKTSLVHLKKRFPNRKFGGPAMAGTGGDWGEEMVREFAAEKVPLDFYSWHGYATDPERYRQSAKWVRGMLDTNGYARTESIFNEWNYVKNFGKDFKYSLEVERGRHNQKGAAFLAAAMCVLQDSSVDMAMYYDARNPGMNGLFDRDSGCPLRGYYPFVIWSRLRKLGTEVRVASDLGDVYAVAARNAEGRLGVFIVRYDEDNNVTSPIRLTVRRASGKPLTDATLHLTDDWRIHTESYFEGNADGSIDLTLHPCSFAFLELK